MLSAQVIVENNTGHAINVTECEVIFQVLLASAAYRQDGAALGCAQGFTIPVGKSSYPAPIHTTYDGCVQGAPRDGVLSCLPGPNILPPLPPGDYQATLVQFTKLFTEPPPIAIRITS